MKKIVLGLLSLFLVLGAVNAQEEGIEALMKGSKMIQEYGANANDNADQLDEGLMLVDQLDVGLMLMEKAFNDEAVRAKAKNYIILGSAYSAVVLGQINAKLKDSSYPITKGELALKAMDAFKIALDLAETKDEKNDALTGFKEAESYHNKIKSNIFK